MSNQELLGLAVDLLSKFFKGTITPEEKRTLRNVLKLLDDLVSEE